MNTEQRFFAELGHFDVPCLLSSAQLSLLLRRRLTADQLYAVNADMYCGWSFAAAYKANVPKQAKPFKFRLCQFTRKASEHWLLPA